MNRRLLSAFIDKQTACADLGVTCGYTQAEALAYADAASQLGMAAEMGEGAFRQMLQSGAPGIRRIFNWLTEKLNSPSTRGIVQDNLESKLADYLFNRNHPQNQFKADWFDQALGFNQSNWREFARQLYFDELTAVPTQTTQFGQHFRQTIPIVGVNGRTISVPVIFIKAPDGTVRFVTSLPPKGK